MIKLFFQPTFLRIGFLIALVWMWHPTVSNASNLPECTDNYWHNCQGTRAYVDGDKYVGEYKDDRRDGEGTSTYANGTKYVGEWKDGKMNGQGTFRLADGTKFIGEWKDGKRNGQGVLYEAKGSIIQSGVWTNDKFIGQVNVELVAPFASSFKYSSYKDIIDGKVYCGAIIAPDKIYGDKKQFIEYLFVTKQDDAKFTISLKLEPSQIFLNLLNNLTKLGSEDFKKEIIVEYRFDQSNGLSEKWITSASQKSIERPKSYDFINNLIEAKILLIRTFDFMGNQHVSKFTFDDDRSAILRTINNCASVEDLKKSDATKKLEFKIQTEHDDARPINSISNFEDNLLDAMKVAEENQLKAKEAEVPTPLLEPEPKPEPKPGPKPAAAPKTPQTTFNSSELEKLLLSKDKPQQPASTAKEASNKASAGTQTGTAAKLSLTQQDMIAGILKEQIWKCWNAPSWLAGGENLRSTIKFNLKPDGSLEGTPENATPSDDPSMRTMAESAIRAIKECAPYKIPAQFKAFYEDWKKFNVTFDMKEVL